MRKFNQNNMMAFCNIHCLRKSSRIIGIPTTSVNVLWDAIVPLSSTPTLIDRPFAKHRNSLSFGTYQWCFLTLTINDVDTQAYIRKRIFHLGKGVYIYVFFSFFSCINTTGIICKYLIVRSKCVEIIKACK